MKVVLDAVTPLANGVWLTEVSPQSLRLVGPPKSSAGEVSILLLPHYSPGSSAHRLEFKTEDATVLNVGTTSQVVVVFGRSNGQSRPDEATTEQFAFGPRVQSDDQVFLEEIRRLSGELQDAGRMLLDQVRREFAGFFQKSPKGRFVNRPDNFWTIKIQPQDQSFRVTVRGRPELFSLPPEMKLRDDRPGYSAFKIADRAQADLALDVLRLAAS